MRLVSGREPSLLRRLLLALVPALLLLAAIGASLDHSLVRGITDEAYDRTLAEVALGLAARLESERDGDLPRHLGVMLGDARSRRFALLDADGRLLGGDPALAAEARAAEPGAPVFAELPLDGAAWRVVRYRYDGPDGRALIAVAEPQSLRETVAGHAWRHAAWTNLLMIAAVLTVVLVGVRMALAPLRRLGGRVSAHDVRRLEPLHDDAAPAEVRPLIDGLNRLIARLREAQAAEQAFLDATAHQLRTPLAALQAQLDLIGADGEAARARLPELRRSVERLTRTATQMLALARTGSGAAQAAEQAPVDLEAVLQAAAAEQLDRAVAAGVDLVLETTPASVPGQGWMLQELAANLVDNALGHAPGGSCVVLRCGQTAGGAFLEVEDQGPGIAPADRERVFERFVRLAPGGRSGSGLGLAIVREVAQRHGGTVQVLDAAGGRGARLRVEFGGSLSAN